MTDNATRWECVCPIQRNEFATDFHPVAATRSADVPRVMLPATSKEWAISGRSTGPPSNCESVIMVWCIPVVSMIFKRRWVLLLSLMCAVETEDDCFRYTCTVSVLVSKHFFSIPIPNRCWRYRPIPSTRCQYRSHPTDSSLHAYNLHRAYEFIVYCMLSYGFPC